MKHMKYLIKYLFLLLLPGIFLLSGCSQEPVLTLNGQTMGTWYTVKICGVTSEHDKERIQMAINVALTRVNRSLNLYDPNSEISRFNDYKEAGAYPLSSQFIYVSSMAESIYIASNGAFDPTVTDLVGLWGFGNTSTLEKPDAEAINNALTHVGMDKIRILKNGILKKDSLITLNYSAIAKGYGVDELVSEIKMLEYENLLVEIGGEVSAQGTQYGKSWRIGIAKPDEYNIQDQQSTAVITLQNMACATSGDYRQFYEIEGKRYSHLIDPKTGYPIEHEVSSVTIIAENCMLADAAATAAIVMGKTEGMKFVESLENVEGYFIYRDGDTLKSLASSGWKKYYK